MMKRCHSVWLRLPWMLFGLVGPLNAQTSDTALATAAIDSSLYRDGEVQRRNQMFKAWALDCDEIIRMKQRFCSLRTLAYGQNGKSIARITISTDDRGQPAALLDLPLGVDLGSWVEIVPEGGLILGQPSAALVPSARRLSAALRARSPGGREPMRTNLLTARLKVSVCDAYGCHAVWTLAPTDIAALRAGANLQLTYQIRKQDETQIANLNQNPLRVDGKVLSEGIDDAIKESIR